MTENLEVSIFSVKFLFFHTLTMLEQLFGRSIQYTGFLNQLTCLLNV